MGGYNGREWLLKGSPEGSEGESRQCGVPQSKRYSASRYCISGRAVYEFLDFTGRDQVTLIRHRQDLPTLELMFTRLRTRMGLFVVGAGASAGSSPLGRDFWRESPLDYLRDLRSFPATVTPQGPLTQGMIDHSGIEIGDIFPGRELRPGTDEYPFREILTLAR